MSFRIEPGKPVGDEFRRVALNEFEAVLCHLRDPDAVGLAVAVHETRKSCKRLRALFRLVRPSIPDRRYRSLNAAVRDAARELSASRDAEALVGMFDHLIAAHGADPEGDLNIVRKGLEERVADREWGETERPPRPLVRACERLELARDTAATTQVSGDGFRALRGGLAATYRRGRKALRELQRDGTAEQSHEWRKAVKYSWHHLQLLEDTAPSVLGPTAARFHELSDALGDAHNLAVLKVVLERAPARFGGPETTEPVLAMADLSRADLEQRAIRLGLRLYAEPPPAFVRRLHAYWRAERNVGDELPTGELADITEHPDYAAPEAMGNALEEDATAGG
ncbi:MAG: CHAD domain-containing protein [Actinomycetota bacterium]|nr:CHAD domain-containing protein [Actinomycetota bacterium]